MKHILYLFFILSISQLFSCKQSSNNSTNINIANAKKEWPNKSWSNEDLYQLEDGKRLYRINCAACHLSSGKGQQQTIGSPALKNNSIIKGPIASLVNIILDGRNSMPAFRQSLTNEELAAIISYLRNAWGHDSGSIVKQTSINSLRSKTD